MYAVGLKGKEARTFSGDRVIEVQENVDITAIL
jgi:hypothetical protein